MTQFLSNFDQKFEPTETFMDPVSKIRVSNPENLIDTDFEYGLQSTKWETLELSNNVPSFYVSDSDLPIASLVSVNATAGSNLITVTTGEPHGLVPGTPIDVKGLTSRTAEGKFLIKTSSSDTTFSYEATGPQNFTGNLGSIYTAITPGQFYSGSQIPFDPAIGIQTNGSNPSFVRITTEASHGFRPGSAFYLVNSVGTKATQLDSVFSDIAPDNRPYVDHVDSISTLLDINENLTETKQMKSTYFIKIDASNVNVTSDTITWPAHGLRNNDTVLYVPPAGSAAIGGLERFQVYYLRNVTTDTFELSASYNGAKINLTSTGAYSFGRGAFHLCYEIRRIRKRRNSFNTEYFTQYNQNGTGSGWDLASNIYGVGNKAPNFRMVFSTTSYQIDTRITENYFAAFKNSGMIAPEGSTTPSKYNFIEDFERYRTYRHFNNSTTTFGNGIITAVNEGVTTNFSAGDLNQYPSNRNLFMMFLDKDEEAETFYAENHGLETGTTIDVFKLTGTDMYMSFGGTSLYNETEPVLYGGATASAEVISSNRFKLVYSGNVSRIAYASGTYSMTANATNRTANSFYYENHGWADNDELFLDNSAGTVPTTNTGPATLDTRFSAGNLFAAWTILDNYMDSYTTALAGHQNVILNGSANSTQPITTGVASGSSLLSRHSMGDVPLLKSVYKYDASYNPQNDLYNNKQLSTTVKDAAEGTAFAGQGWGYAGTTFSQNASVPHYSLAWGVGIPNAQDVTEFRVYSRTFASSMSTYSQNNITKTVGGDGNWRTTYAARYSTDGSAAGYVELNVAIWNLDWTPSVTDTGISVVVGSNDNNVYMVPTSGYTSSMWNKPVYFKSIFMLEAGATFNNASVDSLVDGMVTEFGTNFAYPELVGNSTVYTRVLNNNRFVLRSATGFDYNLTSTGAATLTLSKSGVAGANDGAFSIVEVEADNQFTLSLPYTAPQTQISFDSTLIADNLITTSTSHFFTPGSQIEYENNGNTSLTGLTDGSPAWVAVYDENTIGLATSYDNALQKVLIPLVAGTGVHILKTDAISGRTAAVGTVDVEAGSKKVKGSDGTLFKRYYKVGDNIGIKNTSVTPNVIESFTVAAISDDQNIELTSVVPFTSTATKYFVTTKLYVRPDGYSVHRSFDGGVEIGAGTAPFSQVVRQTRKYFRYQSGKGIQNSLAINFNPPIQLETLEAVTVQTPGTGTLNYTVTNDGTDSYLVNDVANAPITVVRGQTYTINVDAVGHPFWIQTVSGAYSLADLYTEGTTNLGVDQGTISWTVPETAPNTLYYVCENHATMGGEITVVDEFFETTYRALATTRYPHRLSLNANVAISGSDDNTYNGAVIVDQIVDDFTFGYALVGTPIATIPGGIIQFNMAGYEGAVIRAGMFDFQNGFFYEYDGNTVYCVRRSSTQQLSGEASVVQNSNIVRGTKTNYLGQLQDGDMIVIRGASYRVTKVVDRTTLHVQPQYKGISASNVIVTKTIDTKIPQSQWSIDSCFGTGVTGYTLNVNKIQMAYMDYSWYGAGKIRFGFKDSKGHVKYVHEFIHNNLVDEAYMRSGNLPGRYEILNGSAPDYAPALFHWGTSVIMDGTFDDDKAYLFTADSSSLTFTNGQEVTALTSAASQLTSVYNRQTRTSDWYVRLAFPSTTSNLNAGTKLYTADGELSGQAVTYTQFSGSLLYAYVFIQNSVSSPTIYPSVGTSTSVYLGTPPAGSDVETVNLGTDIVPLITVRLAPSADSSLTGAMGAREIVNRMQLKLNEVGMILTHDCEVKLIINGDLSTVAWENVSSPSLSQLIRHSSGDKVIGGVEIFSFRASGGSTDNTGKRLSATSDFDLGDIIDMGNSILGGDGTFPNGPDILTVAVKVVDTQDINAGSPFTASSRITWAESQA